MYKINVLSQFSSAHKLENYEGSCRNLHGHNWKVRIGITCNKTDELGLTIDFGTVKNELNKIIKNLDHSFLNELDCFKDCNPTSENIARYFYKELSKNIKVNGCKVSEVEVWESDKTSMIYYE